MRPRRRVGSGTGTADSSALVYGCFGFLIQLLRRGHFDDLAEVHHRDVVADVLDHGEVVGDEQERDAVLALQAARSG